MSKEAGAPGPFAARAEASLSAIERWQPHVNAMITTTGDRARRDAAEADRDAAAGRWRGLVWPARFDAKRKGARAAPSFFPMRLDA